MAALPWSDSVNVGKIIIGALVVFSIAGLIALGILAMFSSQTGAPSDDALTAGTDIPGPGDAGTVKYSVDNAMTAYWRTGKATVQIASAGKTVTYQVELADTPAEISRGLKYRTALAPDSGMLFVFDGDANRYFWMENTLIPLDMIYISSDGRVVGVRENAVPGSTVNIDPPGPCMYVLEVRGGQCRQYGICAGDPVAISMTGWQSSHGDIRSPDNLTAIKTV